MSREEELLAWPVSNIEDDPTYTYGFANYFHFERINGPYTVEYIKHGEKEVKTVLIEAIFRDVILKGYKKTGDKKAQRKGYGFYNIPIEYNSINDSIGVLTINTFWGKNFFELLVFGNDYRFKRMLSRNMRRVRRDDPKHLIIDIRKNGGGMEWNIDRTLKYFTDSVINNSFITRLTETNRERHKDILSYI